MIRRRLPHVAATALLVLAAGCAHSEPAPTTPPPAPPARTDRLTRSARIQGGTMSALLTFYVLMWPVLVLAVLVAIAWGFYKDVAEAKREGRSVI